MEFITYLIIVNVGVFLFLALTVYQSRKHKKTMADGAYHHLISHGWLVFFFAVAVNVFYFKGYVSPLLFVFMYTVQHVMKENFRLVETNKWTESVDDAQ